MFIAAIGGLELTDWRQGPEFARCTGQVMRPAQAEGKCLHMEMFARGARYFSLTLWSDIAALTRFSRSGAYMDALRSALPVTAPFQIHHFSCDVPPLPEEAYQHWKAATSLPLAGGF